MESQKPQFDVNLGGATELPIEFHVMKFTAARAQEVSDLSQSLDDSGKTSLIFQRLPRHMRRRVMSHNAKRMPRNVREAHDAQRVRGGGLPSQPKRPSRKYRRRPANLLAEYNRRQRKYVWLETHIWHAKRFHMTEKWGYRLPYSPNDRSYRACYRAAAKHCLIQDISFLCCIELQGPLDELLSGLNKHASPMCGLTFAAKSFLDGSREGQLMFYESEQYPQKAIGAVTFIWKPVSYGIKSHCIWIWVHPSYYKQVMDAFITTFSLKKNDQLSNIQNTKDMEEINNTMITDDICAPAKRQKMKGKNKKKVEEIKLANRNIPFERAPKFKSESGNVLMTLLKDTLNRFRLTGPLSQAVLQEALQLVSLNEDEVQESKSSEKNVQEFCKDTPIPMDIDSIFDQLDRNEAASSKLTAACVVSKLDSTTAKSQKKKLISHSSPNISLQAHHSYWESLHGLASPAELPPHMILSLLVSDPRLHIPDKRSKAVTSTTEPSPMVEAIAHPPSPCASSIWSPGVRDKVTRSKLSTAEMNSIRSKLVVPGLLRTTKGPWNPESSVLGESARCKVPLLLIQRPGSKDPATKRLGFGCGWDLVLPAGWAMPLWLALIFRCAKPSGLREASAHTLECSSCDLLPPDTRAGQEEEVRKGNGLKTTYFRLPPNKRPNYIKLGIACPFQCDWLCLLQDWSISSASNPSSSSSVLCGAKMHSFFVLRDRKLLKQVGDLLHQIWCDMKRQKDFRSESAVKALELAISTIQDHNQCLLPVKVEALHRGVTENLSVICIPAPHDVLPLISGNVTADPVEELHEDKQQVERQKTLRAHRTLLVRLRRRRIKIKRIQEKIRDLHGEDDTNQNHLKKKGRSKKSPTEELNVNHKKKMEELWLPKLVDSGCVKFSGSRKTAGFVTKGDFSFTEAKGCGVGYIAIRALLDLVQLWLQCSPSQSFHKLNSDNFVVLIRSTTSLKYRPAKLNVVT